MRAALGYDRSYTNEMMGAEMTDPGDAGFCETDETRYVGMLGFDGGGDDLNSRMTHPMSRSEFYAWYKASCEYFAMMVKCDATMREVTVSVFDSRDLNSIDAEPVAFSRFS